jgi:hypothetical protein
LIFSFAINPRRLKSLRSCDSKSFVGAVAWTDVGRDGVDGMWSGLRRFEVNSTDFDALYANIAQSMEKVVQAAIITG